MNEEVSERKVTQVGRQDRKEGREEEWGGGKGQVNEQARERIKAGGEEGMNGEI